jgi:hypothetical protein
MKNLPAIHKMKVGSLDKRGMGSNGAAHFSKIHVLSFDGSLRNSH